MTFHSLHWAPLVITGHKNTTILSAQAIPSPVLISSHSCDSTSARYGRPQEASWVALVPCCNDANYTAVSTYTEIEKDNIKLLFTYKSWKL